MILSDSYAVAESLIMHYLAFAKEFYRIAHVGIVCQTQNVVVSGSRFLLCRKVLVKVGQNIALDAYVFHIEGDA